MDKASKALELLASGATTANSEISKNPTKKKIKKIKTTINETPPAI